MHGNATTVANCEADSFWAMPKFENNGQHPFQFDALECFHKQQRDISTLPEQFPNKFSIINFGNVQLVCFHESATNPCIVITDAMLPSLIKWYHKVTCHSEGTTCLEASISRHFTIRI